MENELIEVKEEKEISSNNKVNLPINFITVGEVDFESVRVYLKQDVYKRIEKFAKENMSKEVGSILLGNYIEEDGKKYVVISSFIEAKYTDASASTLTFTHETWDYVNKEKDKKHVGEVIVGWQHTHPGYGIFLSNYDIFIQENFFNLPWQIAYVVDPIADTRGFFEWKNGKVSKMTGFYIYDDVGKEIKISKKTKPERKSISMVSIILSVLLVLSLFAAISFYIEKNNATRKLNETIALQNNIAQNDKSTFDTNKNTNTDNANKKDDTIVEFKKYEIKSGDNLEKICNDFNLDYLENIDEILHINGIDNPNLIYVGQTLYLPVNRY